MNILILLIVGPQTSFDQTVMVVTAVTRSNRMTIGRKWGALVAHTEKLLQDKMDNKEITSNQFRLFMSNLYSCDGKLLKLKPSAKTSEVFETLTLERAWDFLNYYLLESIIEEYGDGRTKEMLKQYKRDLTAYMLVTKMKDHLVVPPTCWALCIPQEELLSSLNTELKWVNITSHSLEYVRDLWESQQQQFSLPEYILVLHAIAKGSLPQRQMDDGSGYSDYCSQSCSNMCQQSQPSGMSFSLSVTALI